MTKIKANDFEASVDMVSTMRAPKALHVVFEDDRPLAEIARDFSGHSRFELTSDGDDGVTIYEGYTRLTSIYLRGGTVSLVLEKEE